MHLYTFPNEPYPNKYPNIILNSNSNSLLDFMLNNYL